MNQSEAMKKLKRMLGPKFGYRLNAEAPDADGRAAAQAKSQQLREEERVLREQVDALRQRLLSDPGYIVLCQRYREVKEAADKQSAISRRYRVTVGTIGELFFTVRAEGDNWADVIGKLDA